MDSLSKLIDQFCDLIDATESHATDEQWEALREHDAVLYAACQNQGIKIPTTPPSMASTASGELRQMRQMGCTGLSYIRTLVGHRVVVTSEWQQTIRQLRAVLESKQGKRTGGKSKGKLKDSGKFTDADVAIISALLKHHEYESPQGNEFSSVANTKPATYLKLCELSGVKSKDTISSFFSKWFPDGGNDEYKRACRAGAKKLSLELARLVPGDVPAFKNLYIDKEA